MKRRKFGTQVRQCLGATKSAVFFALATAAAIATGGLSEAMFWRAPYWISGYFAFGVAILGTRVWHAVQASPQRNAEGGLVVDATLLTLLACVYALIAVSGGLESPLYPLLYAIAAVTPALSGGARSLRLLGALTIVFEASLAWMTPGDGVHHWVLLHLFLIAVFASSQRILLGAIVQMLRRDHERAIVGELGRIRREAEDFRLSAHETIAALDDAPATRGGEGRWLHAAVQAVHDTVFFELDLLADAMGLHSAVLLWTQATSENRGAPRLIIKEMSSASLRSPEVEIRHAGLFSPVILQGKPLRIRDLGLKRTPSYYANAEDIRALCAVPVRDNEQVRGVLVADRKEDRPFDDAELAMLEKTARHIERCVAQERAFAGARRRKFEQEQLYAASVQLSEALGAQAVRERCLDAFARLLPFDLALIFDVGDEHADAGIQLSHARWGESGIIDKHWDRCVSQWRGRVFSRKEPGMVVSAAKNRVQLAPKPRGDASQSVVLLDAQSPLRGIGSIVVLPLNHADRCVGVAVLLARKDSLFDSEALALTGILGHQVGAALQNARLYDAMQRRATTDGLTGLTNHRSFQERLDEEVAAADRSNHPLTLILSDIDHFKRVNDNYGHPVGDAVLRRVAQALTKIARKNDVVARYGGEEFVILMPGSDIAAARALAERLRQEVASIAMSSEKGVFHVTLSLGIAEFRVDARDRGELIEYADQALYRCKKRGRNCVTLWRDPTVS